MATIDINKVMNLPEFQTLYKWRVFMNVPSEVGGNVESIDARCISSAVPSMNSQDFEVSIRGHKTLQAGIADFGNELSLTFVEGIDAEIQSIFQTWLKMRWDAEKGTQELRSKYQVTAELTMLDNQNKPTQTYTTYGWSPRQVTIPELSGDTNDAVKPEITFSFVWYNWKKGGDGSSSAPPSTN